MKKIIILMTLILTAISSPSFVYSYPNKLHLEAGDKTINYTNQSASTGALQDTGTEIYGFTYTQDVFGSFDTKTGMVAFDAVSQNNNPDGGAEITIVCGDVIYPQWNDPTKMDPIDLTVTFDMNGDFFYTGSSLHMLHLYAQFYVKLFTSTAINTYASPNHQSDTNLTDGNEYWSQNYQFRPGTDEKIEIFEVIQVVLNTYNGQSAEASFANTGYITVTLSEGATFTSDSGVFLTQPVNGNSNAVPEPATMLLLGLGLMGLAGVRRKLQY